MEGLTRRGALLAATIAAAAAQGALVLASQQLADLPVVRLEGAADGPADRQTPPPPRPGPGLIPALPVTHLDDRANSADLDAPRTVSITLSSPLPVLDVLLLLFRGTPFSVVPGAGVAGSFIGELKNVTLRQALEAVLFPAALDYRVDDTVIRVFPRHPETRLFELDLLNVRRTAQRRVRSGLTSDGASAADVTVAADSDVFGELGAGVQALLSASGRYHVDRQAGLVQVTDFVERLEQVGVYLEALHVRASRQVRLDARIFEVTLTDLPSIDWAALAARPGSGLRNTSGATAGVTVDDLAALMKAIGDLGTIRHIAAPQVLAMNQEPAVMRVGAQGVTFVSRIHASEGGRTVARSTEPVPIAEGLTLTVVPQIAADGIVQMTVSPTYAERTGEVRSSAGDRVPLLDVTQTDTKVRVRDGQTVVIAGLLRERVRTKESTGLAGLFGAQHRSVAHAELVVLLTPTVVTPGGGSAAGER